MSIKTYGWLSVEKLQFINSHPEVVSLLYDLGLLPEEISARVRGYVEAETERIAKLIEAKVMPKEYEGVPGFQPWKATIEALAKEIRAS